MNTEIAIKVREVLRRHGTTVEQLSQNRRKRGLDGAWKTSVITDVRRAVGHAATLEELAAYLNVSPSKISYYTDLEK